MTGLLGALPRTRIRRRATRFVAVASIAAAVVVAPASASFPGHNGVIVFSSVRKDGSLEIFSMRPNGSSVTRLTSNQPAGSSPAWSPGGKRIAFIAEPVYDPDGVGELWAMNRDATGLVRLARRVIAWTGEPPIGTASDTPAWSPDGRRIAFVCPAGRPEAGIGYKTTLCLVRSNGTGRKRITRPPKHRGEGDGDPTWSPDGKEIAFDRWSRSGNNIFALNLRTGRVRQLTKTRGESYGGDPSWSRQGRIAYTARGRGGSSDIFVMRSDGSGKHNLTRTRASYEYAPSWSPNGKQIVYPAGYEDLFVINADGSDSHRLAFETGGRRDLENPAWSPDGGKIAFDDGGWIWLGNTDGSGAQPLLRGDGSAEPAVTADGSTIAFGGDGMSSYWALHVMNSDGTNVRELSGGYWTSTDASNPSWSPDGQRLAVQNDETDPGIDLVNIDGSDSDRILEDDFDSQQSSPIEPAWSPDGTRIAFTGSYGSSSNVCVFVLATRGWGCRGSADLSYSDPNWSPDGKKIAFDRGNGIGVMDANGGRAHKLIANASQPAWSPDGKKIAFVRYLGRNSEIYVVNVNGTGLKRLTHNPGPDLSPDWQPVAAINHLVDPLAPSGG